MQIILERCLGLCYFYVKLRLTFKSYCVLNLLRDLVWIDTNSRFGEKSQLLWLFFLNLLLKKILIEPLLWARYLWLRACYKCFNTNYLKPFRKLSYDRDKAIIIILIPIIVLSTEGQRVQNASSISHSWEVVQATCQGLWTGLEFCYLWSNSLSAVWPQASDISVPCFPHW